MLSSRDNGHNAKRHGLRSDLSSTNTMPFKIGGDVEVYYVNEPGLNYTYNSATVLEWRKGGSVAFVEFADFLEDDEETLLKGEVPFSFLRSTPSSFSSDFVENLQEGDRVHVRHNDVWWEVIYKGPVRMKKKPGQKHIPMHKVAPIFERWGEKVVAETSIRPHRIWDSDSRCYNKHDYDDDYDDEEEDGEEGEEWEEGEDGGDKSEASQQQMLGDAAGEEQPSEDERPKADEPLVVAPTEVAEPNEASDSEQKVAKMKVAELKEALNEHGITDTSGKKADLVDRLLSVMSTEQPSRRPLGLASDDPHIQKLINFQGTSTSAHFSSLPSKKRPLSDDNEPIKKQKVDIDPTMPCQECGARDCDIKCRECDDCVCAHKACIELTSKGEFVCRSCAP